MAIRELTKIGPPPWHSGDAYGVEHKWTNLFEHIDTFLNSALSFALTAPGVSLGDLSASFEGEGFSGDKLVPDLEHVDPTLFRATYSVPVFVIWGAEDLTAPPRLARALVGARIVSRVLAGLLVGVRSADPLTLSVSVIALTLVAVIACYLPARRAVRIEPVVALRA